MNNSVIKLIIVAILVYTGYYFYQQGYFNSEIALVEKKLNALCDPKVEDCSDIEADLEV